VSYQRFTFEIVATTVFGFKSNNKITSKEIFILSS